MDSLTAPSHADSIERLGAQLEAKDFAEALLVVDEALGSHPDSALWITAKGLLLVIAGEPEQGLSDLARVSRHSGFQEGLGLPTTAFSLLRTLSLEELERATVSEPSDPQAWKRFAHGSRLLGASQREATALQGLLAIDSEDEEGGRRLGALLDARPVDEAISTIEKMLEKQPDSCWLRTLLARSLHRKNKTALALRHLKQAVEADPENLQPHRELARIYIGQTRYEEAEKELTAILQAPGSSDPEALGLLAVCQKATYRYEEALKTLIAALQADLERFEEWDTLVELSEATGQLENLHRFLEGAVAKSPESERLLTRLVQLKIDSGDPVAAEQWLAKNGCLEEPSQSPKLAKQGVEVLLQLGENRRALAVAEKLHQRFPNDQDSTVLLGQTYLAMKMGAEAEALFCNLARFQPNEITFQLGWGRGLFLNGQYEKAHRTFHLASRLDPDSCEALELQALALLELNRIDEANELLKESAKKCESGRALTMFALGRVYESRALSDIARDFYRQALVKKGFPKEAVQGWLRTSTDRKTAVGELQELLASPLPSYLKTKLYLEVLEESLRRPPFQEEQQFCLAARSTLLEQIASEEQRRVYHGKEKALLKLLAESSENFGETETARRVLRSAMHLEDPELTPWAAESLERLDRRQPETSPGSVPTEPASDEIEPTLASAMASPLEESETDFSVEELFDLPLSEPITTPTEAQETPERLETDQDALEQPELQSAPEEPIEPSQAAGATNDDSESGTADSDSLFAESGMFEQNQLDEDDPLMSLLSATIPGTVGAAPPAGESTDQSQPASEPGLNEAPESPADDLSALLDATLLPLPGASEDQNLAAGVDPDPVPESSGPDSSTQVSNEAPSDVSSEVPDGSPPPSEATHEPLTGAPVEAPGVQELSDTAAESQIPDETESEPALATDLLEPERVEVEPVESVADRTGQTDQSDQVSEAASALEGEAPLEPSGNEVTEEAQNASHETANLETAETAAAAVPTGDPIPPESAERKDLLDIPMAVDFEPSTRRQLHYLEAMAHRADALMNPETIAHLLLQSAAAPAPPDPSSQELSSPYEAAVSGLYETAQRLQAEGRYRGAMSVLRTALLYAPQKGELLSLHAELTGTWAEWLQERHEFAHAVTLLREAAKRQPDSEELLGRLLEAYQSWMEWSEGNGDPAARALLSLYLESEHQQLERLKSDWAERQQAWAARQARTEAATPAPATPSSEASKAQPEASEQVALVAADSPTSTTAPAAGAAAPPPTSSSPATVEAAPEQTPEAQIEAEETPTVEPEPEVQVEADDAPAVETAASPPATEPAASPDEPPAQAPSAEAVEAAEAAEGVDPVESLLDSLESSENPDAVGEALFERFQDSLRELISKLRERGQGSSEPVWLLMLARAFRRSGSETMAVIQYQKYLKVAPSPEVYEELAATYEEIGKADFAEMTRKKAQRNFGS